MSEISKVYEPEKVEKKWYKAWLEQKAFTAKPDKSKKPYCIMIPPPNVTGMLTMGHVLNNTIQDILIRRARQQKKEALWLPGTDHAGIATQTRVEKALQKEGKTRHDLGREAFLERAKEWRDTHGGVIIEQLKRLGASCDWDRCVHTLDDDYSHAVLTAFVELYKRGYIYRGKRMVNWCPASLTALSDEEVNMKVQKSTLYHVRYEFVDEPGKFMDIATTRPETIMGDTAIAVHPGDERYKSVIGKAVWRPLNRAKINIIADEAVVPEFGTGALKVTPAHDKTDFEIGQRHNLPIIDVLNPDGTMSELAGDTFKGMDRFKARKLAAQLLEENGALIRTEDYDNNVGYSERADVPIEPRISEQWFLKYPKIEEAKKAVREGWIKFWPERWTKTYLHWLENIQDWCISRQLWWGHRIPVWYKKGADRKDPTNWHVSVEGPSDPENWEQDEDVLDTWASSWLWPFATLGWPNEAEMKQRGLDYFYPTSTLVTGPDIIFFWVARMIIAALEFMGSEKKTLSDEEIKQRIPFENVYFTGIIRDQQGRKMSKSLGNSPDPIDLIDKYGADGLRFGIMSIAPQGQDVIFSEERVHQGRNFCNKLWNACRFRQMSGEMADNSSLEAIIKRIDPTLFDEDDHAILGSLCQTIQDVHNGLDNYSFSIATQSLYAFFWGDFCDWYLEVSKARMQEPETKQNCLAIQDLIIREVLLILHPFAPFITEELWHDLGYSNNKQFIETCDTDDSLNLRKVLQSNGINLVTTAIEEVGQIRDFVTNARSLKAQYQLASKKDLNFFLTPKGAPEQQVIENHSDKLKKLVGAATISINPEVEGMPAVVTPLGTLYLDVSSSIDVEAEKSRLSKELEKLEKLVTAGEAKLNSEAFTSKAPEQIVAGAKKQLEETKTKRDEVKRLLAGMK